MSNISVTTQQSVIAVTQTGNITVTTPEGQTIAVTVPDSNVNVTNTTDDITILTAGQLYINSSGVITSVNGNTGPIVILTTTNIAEGTNLYYTTARANTDFDSRLATKTTDALNEGTTNQYFTTARARASISVSDGGGDGSLSYDNTTGVVTYTGPSATEVRAHFSGGTGVTITDGSVAIGQAVGTTDSVTFGAVSIDSRVVLDTATLTTSATTALQVLDTFSSATYRTAKYLISISSGADYQALEVLVVHNGTTASVTVYADVATGANLATFGVDISGGSVRLLTTPTNAVTAYQVTRTALVV